MATLERQQAIRGMLENFRGVQALKRLTAELNYDAVNRPLSSRAWTEAARETLAAAPVVVAEGGDDGAFKVIYARL